MRFWFQLINQPSIHNLGLQQFLIQTQQFLLFFFIIKAPPLPYICFLSVPHFISFSIYYLSTIFKNFSVTLFNFYFLYYWVLLFLLLMIWRWNCKITFTVTLSTNNFLFPKKKKKRKKDQGSYKRINRGRLSVYIIFSLIHLFVLDGS